jgi:hypothetical protein
MSTQNDLLDGNDSNLERLSSEASEQSDMCLNWQDDVENNFPNCEDDACGVLCFDNKKWLDDKKVGFLILMKRVVVNNSYLLEILIER